VPVRSQPIANDPDGERRLWAYVTIGYPIFGDELNDRLSYLSGLRDLDGDGLPEIAIGCADSVRVVDGHDGRLIWRTEADTIRTIRTISKGDADYMVVRSYSYGHLSLLSAVDGKALWNRSDIGFGINTVIAPDLYGDGWVEIFVDSWSRDGSELEGEVACISGATGSTIWAKSMGSEYVVSMILVKSSLGDVALAIVSGSFDVGYVISLLNARTHDVVWSMDLRTDLPAMELPIITYSESSNLLFAARILGDGSRLAAYDPKDGSVVWEIQSPSVRQLLPLQDLDGDSRGDLLANVQEGGGQVIAISSSSGSTIWSSKLDAPFRPEPAALVGDVDGDGVSDIAVGTGDGRGIVYLLSGANGKILWDFSASTDVYSDISDILAPGDLNGDRSLDIVVSSWDHCVYALSSLALPYTLDTEPPVISNVTFSPTSQRISVSASIADALSDVRMAVIFYSTDGGATWGNITMTTPTSPSTTYEGAIPTQAFNVKVQFYIEAFDAWDNIARIPTQEYIPTIPIWVYGVIGTVMVLLIVFIIGRRRRASIKGI